MRRRLWTLLAVLTCVSGEYLMGGHLDNNAGSQQSGKIENSSTLGRKTRLDDLDLDLVAEESAVAIGATADTPTGDNDGDVPRYHIPYPFAFNGGKPFSLEKDPITGKIDFEKAPPVKALNYTDHYREREDKESEDDDRVSDEKDVYPERKKNKGKENEDVSPNEINTYANFHDFLNLPVHYSSDKYGNDKYPLISSSYANTKVQSGANSYSTYNHRPYNLENDLYVRPIKNSYAPITKTSTHKTTAIDDDKAKRTSPPTITTSVPTMITNSSRTMLSTSTKAPAITTWKPSNTPIAFHSIDRTEVENEKNLLPIEKLHASGHAEFHQNPSNVPMRTTNDGTMMEKTQTAPLHKDHSNLDNFVLSHTKPETKPAQNEEYRDSYDTYESSDGEGEGDGDGEGDSDGNSEETDYFLPFKDLLKEITSESSTTTSPIASTAVTTTTTAATTTTTVTASSAGTTTTAAKTIMPSRSVSSTPSALRENALANSQPQFPMMPQHPIVPSSLNSDRRQSVTERYDDIISHGYRPNPMPVKLEPNRIGAGTVIESTSNIVIPPDQDTVSFVLGNRQSVEGGYYSVGTAVGENLYGSLSDTDSTLWPLHNDPHSLTMKGVKHGHSPAHSVTELPSPARTTQKWWPPSPLKTSNEIEPMKSPSPLVAIASAIIQDTKNRSKEKDSGYVIFPNDETKDKDAATTEERIVIVNEADGSIRELITPKTTTLTTTMATTTTNKTKLDVSATIGGDLPQLADDLIPPAESPRPPSYYYNYQYDVSRPDHSRLPQRSPLPPPPLRIKPHSVPPLDAGLRKRPYSPDTKLPNILPQFRPNAKASHGHRGPDAIGTMPAGQGPSGTRIRQPLPSHLSTSRRPLHPPSPSYLQRLNPPPPPIHAVRLAFVPTSNVDNIALPHETESTIRTRLRPPHVAPSISRVGLEENAKLLAHGIGQAGIASKNSESRKEDHGKSEIVNERENEERYPEEPPMTPPRPPLFPKRRTTDPPRVATLQMIQHHGELVGEIGENDENDENDESDETDEPVESIFAHEAERRKSDNHDPAEIPEQPVYVVYPVNTAVNIHPDDSNEKDGSVVVGTRGPHRPLPPDTLLQNDPAEEAHTVYNGKPLVALDFPYPLERPDPTSVFPAASVKETPLLIPSKQRQQQQQQQQGSVVSEQEKNGKDEHLDAVNVIPYLQDFLQTSNRKKNDATISVTLHRTGSIATASTSTASTSTSTPIAYVYTPTHAPYSIHRLDEDVDDDDEDHADAAANVDVKQTVLLPSQQPSSSSSSAPAPQNFMAPFVASISAETPSKNGWSVVVVEPPAGAERRSDSDGGESKIVSSEIETQTEKNEFDADNFKPQLFGGFKPIYEFPMEDAVRRDVADANTEIDTPRHSKKLLSVPDKG
ncbi:uncharacterized protein LOC115234401 isoform X2 [Formica exsecta]|uniref:uncharacterized protein LOC115234401 isoform X2 n=1 Tax=Formica exsecta TaxID=72781 RepID=UPI00114266FD|nr:uncharacterized protein LOC115234401 isoform X2 [Formica exsecta]